MENIIGIIIAAISATGAVTVQHFLNSWKAKRQGRLDEAQRIADDRDKMRRERDQERRCKHEWEAAFHRLRLEAIQAGVPDEKTRPPQ